MNQQQKKSIRPLCLFIMLIIGSCNRFLEVEPPASKIPRDLVFQDEEMATSAMIGIYLDLYSATGFAGGSNQSVISLAGLSSDELENRKNDPLYFEFQTNEISPSNKYIASFWGSLYKSIYEANALMEGLNASTKLNSAIKSKLKGEALFVRAFCYFYLVNFFGDTPLVISTDYIINNTLTRVPVLKVYDQIISDLVISEGLLTDSYEGSDRIRPNKYAVTALLARVYLSTGDWGRAEEKANNIINKGSLYNLSDSLNSVFLSNSKEAIWQLRPADGLAYTNEGYTFNFTTGPNVLRKKVIDAFEAGDKRKIKWTVSSISGTDTLYLPNKYKRSSSSIGVTDEYSMVLRLAEVFLVRAEAKLRQDKISSAILDVDKIRERAGLPRIQETNPNISKDDLMLAIIQERRIEFLAEWGHRWLDLKRLHRAEIALSPLKPGWNNNDLLYPIPSGELRINTSLQPQNPGY